LVGPAEVGAAAVVAATVGALVAAGIVGSVVAAGSVGSAITVVAAVGWGVSVVTGGAMPSGERVPWVQEICPPFESPEPNPQAARMGSKSNPTIPSRSQGARCVRI
jgi:hypothetical protein